MTETADVVIVGGGLHGCSTALHLARRGVKSLVIEKDHIGRHASGVNAGGVRRLGRDFAEIPLSMASIELWQAIEDLVDDDCGFHATGQVKIAETEAKNSPPCPARAQQVRELGFDHEVDRRQEKPCTKCCPPQRRIVSAGCMSRGTVMRIRRELPLPSGEKANRNGRPFLRRLHGDRSSNVENGGTWRGDGRRTAISKAPVLVNCGGAWADRIAAALGEAVPLTVVRALMMMVTAPMPRFVEPVVGSQGRQFSFKQSANGTVIIGGGHCGTPYRDQNRTVIDFDGLAISAQDHQRCCFRSWRKRQSSSAAGPAWKRSCRTVYPVIGPSAAEEDAYHAFGYCGHGFQLGPIVGSLIADLVTGGNTNLPIEPFRIDRFDNVTGERTVTIKRGPESYPGRTRTVQHNGLIHVVVSAPDKTDTMAGQTRAMPRLDRFEFLAEAGTDKSKLVTATVYLADMARKSEMNDVWIAWADHDNPNAPGSASASRSSRVLHRKSCWSKWLSAPRSISQ